MPRITFDDARIPRVRSIPTGRKSQPVRHFVLVLTDEEHLRLKRASQGMRGFPHAFQRYPDTCETVIQGRDARRITADIREIFPTAEITKRVPQPGDFIFDH